MQRPYNFSAGPAAIPEEVLQTAAAEMLNWHGSGMSVMEMSHRGKEFISIAEQAEADFRQLLAVPQNFHILFMQGGGLAENAIVPLNLSQGGDADFVVTGSWSQKSVKEAGKFCNAAAAACGARVGMVATQAQALIPDLDVRDADPAGDADALDRLALWAMHLYAPVCQADPPDGLAIDITGADYVR